MSVFLPSELDASQLLLSQSAYGYGPNAKILYTDYVQPRASCDILFGPFETPFGLSCFQGDKSKTSISIRIPQGNPILACMAEFDEGFKKMLLKSPVNLPVPLTWDLINRLWIPSIQNDLFGSTMRFSVKSNADGLLKALFLKRSVGEDGKTSTENITGLSTDELFEIFSARSVVYVLCRLTGIAISKTSIQPKFSVVQLVSDSTTGFEHQTKEDKNYTIPLTDDYFQ
jgi:hypothetical protein